MAAGSVKAPRLACGKDGSSKISGPQLRSPQLSRSSTIVRGNRGQQSAPTGVLSGIYELLGTLLTAPKRSAGEMMRLKADQRPSLSRIEPRGSVCGVVLGGGEKDSRRLFPLTEKRTLPAIPLAGQYRLIDIPLSNLINSGVNKIYVLTQYNSTSLNRYLQHTYDFHGGIPFGGDGFMEVVAATQAPGEQRWADGAADTVRQWLNLFNGAATSHFIEDILILPSDQVYKMDFTQLVNFHRQTNADLTIVCRPVERAQVDQVGIVKLQPGAVIESFEEKPSTEEAQMLMSMEFDDMVDFINEEHLTSVPFSDPMDGKKLWIGSCGMYLFRKEALNELMANNKRARDFGRELIPDAIQAGMKVMAYNFPEYWVDVGGSIKELFDFNMGLTKEEIPFSFEDPETPFFGSAHNVPPTTLGQCHLSQTLLGPGCSVGNGTSITSSTVGLRSVIGGGCTIEETVIMGADYYEADKQWKRKVGPLYPHIGIGSNTMIRKAVIDKNARIGNGVQLLNKEGVYESMDRLQQGIAIRDGLIVISKSAVIPDGTEA